MEGNLILTTSSNSKGIWFQREKKVDFLSLYIFSVLKAIYNIYVYGVYVYVIYIFICIQIYICIQMYIYKYWIYMIQLVWM